MTPPARIPIAGPSITEKEINYVAEAVRTAWYENANLPAQRFEQAMAERIGRRFAIALPSCTSALHLSLSGLGIGAGDEVIVPELTWIATAAPILYVGATPVFADVNPIGWCLDAESLKRCVTPRTKAAIVVDLYGSMPDWAALELVAKQHNFPLIEDAAQAIGALYRGRPAGAFGAASTFSFHGSKTLTTGEGGMLLTDDEALHRRCLLLRDHGQKPGGARFFNEDIGFKYRMSAMQAALGLAQLERLDELAGHKRQIFEWYRKRLARQNEVMLNDEPTNVFSTYWMVTALVDAVFGIKKEELILELGGRGIDSRPVFYPLSMIPALRDYSPGVAMMSRNPVSYNIAWRGINLPSGHNMTEALVDRVAGALMESLESLSNRRKSG